MIHLLPIIVASGFRPIVATGGSVTDITVSGTPWRVHTFTSSGTFSVTDSGSDGNGVEYLIVAGGGGGGGYLSFAFISEGGAGGAGGYLTNIGNNRVSVFNQNYPITIGLGGSPGVSGFVEATKGTNGGNSFAFDLTAIGGGGGGATDNSPTRNGSSGGSGGGGSSQRGLGGAGTSGQGHAGASGSFNNSGGGGGAGGPATIVSNVQIQGPGIANSITGSAITYAEGGFNSIPTANTGSGGKRGTATNGSGLPSAGASGIVVIRYPLQRA